MPPQLPHPDPGTPDTRGPLRYIWWLARSQPVRVLRGSLLGTLWMTGLALRPYLIAKAVDDGLRARDNRALLLWVAAIVVAGLGQAWIGILRHRTMTFVREDATARSAAVLLRQLSRAGAVLSRKLAAGEVATVGGSDIGNTSHVLTMTGPGVGAVVAYAVVAVMLWSISPRLATCILLGVPLTAAVMGPMLRRLDRVETVYRHRQGLLTARAGDIVAGLRVLAGVGGRGLFARRYTDRSQELLAEGYRVGAVNSWIRALTGALPGLFLAVVVWLAARMAADGDITVGQMVAVYGYVAVLVVPVWFLLDAGYQLIKGRVAARRIVALLTLTPDEVADPAAEPVPVPDRPAELHDPVTGLTVRPGQLVAVAADDPAQAAALADRLGRYVVSGATWGGRRLTGMPLAQVRSRILVADHDSYLFAGTLREVLRIRDDQDDHRLRDAVRVASADDVVDALPDGLDTALDTRARRLSGGQRQRVRLARALLAEPEVLILLDPTSAVDAHTEARIAARLRDARAGRTTLLLGTSPLLLGHADTVAYLAGGRIVAIGTHPELLDRESGYRALVARDPQPHHADTDTVGEPNGGPAGPGREVDGYRDVGEHDGTREVLR
ncbi:ABC transporter ATP-binding protein [Plantactinospora sp. B5E13]|uniref:ABC transporter ATP-binding protein n=1 Tax=Plantactinospora sp. B5E13 TaxID=3153758 RepID=UPI00325E5C2D